jgi:hypothetical protein
VGADGVSSGPLPFGAQTDLPSTGRGNRRLRTIAHDARDQAPGRNYNSGAATVSHHDGDREIPVALLLNGSYLVQGATTNALKKLTRLPLGNGLTPTWQSDGIDHQIGAAPIRYAHAEAPAGR